jgi:hypothetical protein
MAVPNHRLAVQAVQVPSRSQILLRRLPPRSQIPPRSRFRPSCQIPSGGQVIMQAAMILRVGRAVSIVNLY